MKPFKPLFLNTYGKLRRTVPAWISPDDRKQVFDSTTSTDDMSVFEPPNPKRPRPKRTTVGSRREARLSKKKAMRCLTEKSSVEDEMSDAENIIPSSAKLLLDQQSGSTRPKRTTVGGRREVRLSKKKAMRCLTEKSSVEDEMSDAENIIPSSAKPLPAQQSEGTRGRTTRVSSRKSVRAAKKKAVLSLSESSSNEDNIMKPSSPLTQRRRKTTKSAHGRSQLVYAPVFTRMRGQAVAVPSETEEEEMVELKDQKISAKLQTDSNALVRSAGRFVTRRRRAASSKLQKAIASILRSSDEFTAGAFPSSRIHPPSKRRRVPTTFGLSSAESSVNATGVSSFTANPFREISLNESADHILGPCPRKPIFCSTPSAGPLSKRGRTKIFPTHDEVATSPSCIGVLTSFQEDPVSPQQSESACGPSCEERLQRAAGVHHIEDVYVDLFTEPQRGTCRGASKRKHSGELASTTVPSADGESSSRFVSAAGGLQWLTEALKEKCLSSPCTVQLERLDHPTVTQLCSQTTYTSCLEHSGSFNSRKVKGPMDSSQSVVFFHSSEESFTHQISAANRKSDYLQASADVSASSDHKKSAECLSVKAPVEELQSVLCVGSIHQADQGCEVSMSAQLAAGSSEVTGFTEQEAKTVKGKKCTVQLQKLSSSSSFGESRTGKSLVVERESTGEEETAAPTSILKEKCLTDSVVVKVKRTSLSQLRKVLQPRDASLKSSTDTSDSASDDKAKTCCPSESDCNENKASLKVNHSTSSESKISSGSEAEKSSQTAVPKRKKGCGAAKDKKRKSTSTDRSGTARKVCVSGMSTSRWKNKGADAFRSRAAQLGGAKTGDCSISEMISKQPAELAGSTMNLFTPVRASRLNMSSLLADLTPDTHTWSRLKAALSVHRKGMVQLTPRNCLSTPASARRMAVADLSRDLFSTPLRTPLPRHLQSQLPADVSEDPDLSDAEKVYAECSQQQPLPWEECIPPRRMKQCVKIGEGTFGEVFSTTKASGETVALKVIPVEGSEKVNGEDQKTFGEILHEIIISKELSSLKEKQQNQTHGFIGLNGLHCVQGCYPADFLKAWDVFDKRKVSENDRPDFYEKDQLFIILEFEFGGVDLENSSGTLASLGVAKSILHQVTAALAVAEQKLRFEHRDLHWGNVLVKTTKQKSMNFLLNGTVHSVETKGVLVRIIDYSLSRLEIDDLTVSCDISNDEELFMGQGDYQFDIYRLMRQENRNNWSSYHPHTNVLWLHYLCSKLLSMKYRGTGGRSAKNTREELTCFYDNVLQYRSATEALQNCSMFQ